MAYACSIAVLFLLLRSVGTTAGQTVVLVLGVLAVAVPASRVIVRYVERKRFGFTVAGAAFVDIFAAPLIVVAVNEWSGPGAACLDMLPVLAARAVAYCLGEGMGRLACISFGCCYGRLVEESPVWLRPLLRRFHFVFRGGTKKSAITRVGRVSR